MSYDRPAFWKLYESSGFPMKMDGMVVLTDQKVCKAFEVLTCENGHPMFLTLSTLYVVGKDFPYPGIYFKDKLLDLNDGKDIYTCKTCKASAVNIDSEGLAVFVRGKRTLVWRINLKDMDNLYEVASAKMSLAQIKKS